MSETHLPNGLCSGVKSSSKQYHRQLIVIHNRITNREKALRGFKQHLKNGTFPKRMKSLKPYPKMENPQAQTLVNEACEKVERVMLDQKIQDYERKLQGDRASLQSLKDTRREQRLLKASNKATQIPKPLKKVTVLQLQQELRDLQTKYTELSQKLSPVKQEPQKS